MQPIDRFKNWALQIRVDMTTESRIKELEDRIARTEAVNLALLLVVQTLVRRSDDYTFIEVLELLE